MSNLKINDLPDHGADTQDKNLGQDFITKSGFRGLLIIMVFLVMVQLWFTVLSTFVKEQYGKHEPSSFEWLMFTLMFSIVFLFVIRYFLRLPFSSIF